MDVGYRGGRISAFVLTPLGWTWGYKPKTNGLCSHLAGRGLVFPRIPTNPAVSTCHRNSKHSPLGNLPPPVLQSWEDHARLMSVRGLTPRRLTLPARLRAPHKLKTRRTVLERERADDVPADPSNVNPPHTDPRLAMACVVVCEQAQM